MSNILITGCRGGFGLGTATSLAKLGHKVYATVHREESVREVENALKPYGNNTVVEKLDITDSSDREKAARWNIDTLINNAAIGDSGPLIEIDIRRIKDVFETNVYSTIQLTQTIGKKMIERRNGRIIIIGSMFGLVPTPFIAPYGMSKFALESFAYSLRKEVKPFGIYVVMINPGAYDTGFNKKNIMKKYEWMSNETLYKDYMNVIKKEEDFIYNFEIKDISKIVKQIVKAATAKKPSNRYVAPRWLWIPIPLVRKLS